jgi:hypothetical protein
MPASPPAPSAGSAYDVMAIIAGLEAQGVDADIISAVCDSISHLDSSTLDVLRTCGVPARTIVAVKKDLRPYSRKTPVGTHVFSTLERIVCVA